MYVVEHADPESFSVRSHPWHGSVANPDDRHLDLRAHPALIRTALDPLLPWAAFPAMETFYTLLEWLNGPSSILETNDCTFNGPSTNETADFDKALQCSGRLMLLFRDLPQNRDEVRVHRLTESIARTLATTDEGFVWGVVGATIVPVRFRALPGNEQDQRGWQLMLSFWAWGDHVSETMAHLDRTLANVSQALREHGR